MNNITNEFTYEQAYSRLEEIVYLLENQEHPLEEALKLYEEGHTLAELCIKLLDQAELRVKSISGDTNSDYDA